jgi:hypothetical protein
MPLRNKPVKEPVVPKTFEVLDRDGQHVGKIRKFKNGWEVQPLWFPRNTWQGRCRTRYVAEQFLVQIVEDLRSRLDVLCLGETSLKEEIEK